MIKRTLLGSVIGLAAILLAAFAVSWQPAWPPLAGPAVTFDPALVARGEQLVHVGNCAGCHTAQGGRPFAGGRPLETPFGTVFATNITPDPETGIGRWSRKAFVRALREGVALNGDLLYPAFPYDHFTHASDSDIDALYAFLMTRPAVQARTPANRLKEPFGFRPLVAGWNLLFLHKGPLVDEPGQSADWNRGRALAEGLAHCGGCHTPRNELGAERSDHAYDGAWTEGWYAPAAQCHFTGGAALDRRRRSSPTCAPASARPTPPQPARWPASRAGWRRRRRTMSARSPSISPR